MGTDAAGILMFANIIRAGINVYLIGLALKITHSDPMPAWAEISLLSILVAIYTTRDDIVANLIKS